MTLKEKFKQDFSLLIEGGFIAVKQGNRDAAEKLFRAAQVIEPDHTAPLLGFGFIAMNCMDLQNAKKYFDAVLQKDPKNAPAKGYLGFCFILPYISFRRQRYKTTNPKDLETLANAGANLVREAMGDSDEEEIHRFGNSVLELLQKVEEYRDTPLSTAKPKK